MILNQVFGKIWSLFLFFIFYFLLLQLESAKRCLEERPGMLLNITQCTGSLLQQMIIQTIKNVSSSEIEKLFYKPYVLVVT